MSEQETILLQKVKNSNQEAFKKLFSNFHDTLFRFVAYRVKDSDLAEDITQETFLRVWKNRNSLTYTPQKNLYLLLDKSTLKDL